MTSAEAPCPLPVLLLSRFSVVRLQCHVLCPVRALIPTPHGESASRHLSNTLFPLVLKDLLDTQGICAFSVYHSFIALSSRSDLGPASKGSKSVRYPLYLKQPVSCNSGPLVLGKLVHDKPLFFSDALLYK